MELPRRWQRLAHSVTALQLGVLKELLLQLRLLLLRRNYLEKHSLAQSPVVSVPEHTQLCGR